MGYELYQDVVIATDGFVELGVTRGMKGYVLEVYEEGGYEVEVDDANGEAIALFAATEQDLAAADDLARGGA